MSGWDQRNDQRDYVRERRSNAFVIAIFLIGGTVSFLSGLKRTDAWAVMIGVFLLLMAFILWRLR